MRITLSLILLASVSWAQESVQKIETPAQTLSTTTGELEKPSLFKNVKASGRVTLMTAQATHPVTYRHLKTTGVDDNSQNASGSERTTAPNLRYLSAHTSLGWTEKHETSFGLVKSLSSAEDRVVTTPFGVNFTMPGEIIFVRQSYYFTPNYSASLSGGYTDIAEYRDPSLSFGYQSLNDLGFAPRWSLSASAPATPTSYKNGLITKASLRAGVGYRAVTWGSFANVSLNQGFYKDMNTIKRAHGVTASARHPGAPGGPGGPPGGARPTFDTTDLVMSEVQKFAELQPTLAFIITRLLPFV